ncbi:MAG: CDP-alcohol phosphatidyltransferase family protein [Anaerolineae bacterium]|nr:CDP-alcohol phosphatidyltransferase family protein [Anaerolineae bacterium]
MPRHQIANGITASRILFIPGLIYAAGTGSRDGFALIFAIQLGVDWLDGIVARRLKITSELGRKLDTWVDFFVWAAAITSFIVLMEDELRTLVDEYPLLFVTPFITASLLHGTAYYYLRRPSTMHLYSAKLTGGMILVLMAVMLLDRFYLLLGGLTTAIAVLYHLEGIVIYGLLKAHTDENITSIVQVRKHLQREKE